jgi:PAS domain S-box-containing protein
MRLASTMTGASLHRLVVDNIAELVALVDDEAIVLYASPGHTGKLGYDPDELVGRSLAAFVHPDDRSRVVGALACCLADGRAQLGEFRLHHADGHWLVVDGAIRRIDTEESTLLLVTVREVTERVHAEREFVANAAHELLTPLAAMKAAIEVLQSGAKDVPHERDAFLADLQREVERLGRLAQALLVLARVQATGETVACAEVQLCPLLREVARAVRSRPGVVIEIECDGALVALGERGLLERALTNLADNAAAHTQRGAIVLAAGPAGAGRVEIEVRDTGCGMDAAEREQAFERFSRTGGRGREGFGLGLAIVREVVRALDGRVEIESRPGVGTIVRLTLPAPPR